MKVLLTVPIACYRRSHPDIPDLGLGYLASALRRSRHTPSVLDWGRRDTEGSFADFFRACDPEAVGIKCFTKNFRAVQKTIRLIRQLSDDVPIILGGPHASAERPEKLFRDFPGMDFAIRGEGEDVLPHLISALEEGRSAPPLPGLLTASGPHEEAGKPCVIFEDLENLRPAWDLLDPSIYTPVTIGKRMGQGHIAPITGTRGCSHACTFCSTPLISGNKVRFRNRAGILDEMDYLAREFGVNQFVFVDMNFTHDPARLIDFCGALGKKSPSPHWNCVASPRFYEYADPSLLRTLKKSGCHTLVMGIETASNRVRERVKKRPAMAKITAAAHMAKEAGIGLRGYFMYGFPDETMEEMEYTYHYAFSGLFDYLSFDLCFPLPGTEMLRQYLETTGLKELDWASFSPEDPPVPICPVGSAKLKSIYRKSRIRAMLKDRGMIRTSLAALRKMSSGGKRGR